MDLISPALKARIKKDYWPILELNLNRAGARPRGRAVVVQVSANV